MREGLEGEVIALETNYVVLMKHESKGPPVPGSVVVSNYRIYFVPELTAVERRVVSVPFGRIVLLSETGKAFRKVDTHQLLHIATSDVQLLTLGFSKKAAGGLASFMAAVVAALPSGPAKTFALARGAAVGDCADSWGLQYDARAELEVRPFYC